jgi:hypothetical protein
MPDVIELQQFDGQIVTKKIYIYNPKTTKFKEKVIKRTSNTDALDEFFKINEVIREQPPFDHR